jgi:hypothetical protein
MAEPATRAVVSDDGSTIWLTAYTEAGEAVPVAIEPERAVALAGDLIRAALPKLGVVEKNSIVSAPKRRRGGDPRHEQRRELYDGLYGMASLLGLDEGKPAIEVARKIIDRCNRYQPLPVETDPVRCEMQRLHHAGVRLPTSDRYMARIISGGISKARAKNPIGSAPSAPIK